VTYTVDTQQATINFVTTDGVGLGSVAVTGASGSDIPASAYQGKLAELIADDYTLQTNNVAGAQFDTDSTQPQSFEIVMHAPVTLNVSYIDDADGRAITVAGALHTLSGAQGTSGSYTVRVPEHYDLAKGQAAVVDYTLNADAAPIVIHLTHQVAYSEVMTTRTINYVVTDNGAAAPASVTQKLNWKIATDLVTGATVATPQGAYGAVVSPTVTGFTPDQARVASSTPSARTSRPTNAADQAVTYTADTQRATIKFVVTDGKALGTVTVSGPSGSAIATSSYAQKLTALEAQGYSLVSDGTAAAHFDTDSTRDQEFEVVLRPASSTDNGGGTTTNNGGGTTTDNGGGTTTNNGGGTTSDNGAGTTTNNGGGTTTDNGGGTTTNNGGGATTGNPGNSNDTPQNLPSTFDDGSGATKGEGDAKTETTGTNSKASGEQALPVTGGVTANAAQTIQQATAKQNVLPQTGDDNGSVLTILGVGLAGLLSMFGLARKRQHEDD
jgi:LPXTG-motif cell wall-anchored protein